jgi:hypothetical protein
MYHTITNRLFRQGLAAPTKALQSLRMDMSTGYTGWDHHDMGGGGKYT